MYVEIIARKNKIQSGFGCSDKKQSIGLGLLSTQLGGWRTGLTIPAPDIML